MDEIRCIVADDEPIARQILESYIKELPNLNLVASCKNAFEVMDVLQKETVHLLFLDINMPKLSGISLLKTLQVRPSVIITTAYSEYAVEGFELSVTDYLLKPFSFERFLKAVMKVQQKPVQNIKIEEVQRDDFQSNSIFVKSEKKIIKLNLDDISHIEAYGNYIKVYAGNMILVSQTLSEFLTKLPNNFIRIHKSYIINFKYLKLIDGNQILLHNEVKLVIGKSFRKELLLRIDKEVM
ncbi:LytTR family DNA-binding domain-containing protein [uncultured Tenacibaculum sp.]|uniref:LytR/AlgR family response regulator transcription factor n=1 Tax=uncultured Tenacibaculum sp. TaxID=174713 RepID=UPI00260D4CF1|nr:LytTR family DNA-binding domain-containing protein [uncultured Tenacibaculum sp.]